MTDFPVTAERLLQKPFSESSNFFLLCRVDETASGSRILVEPGFPLAVNNEKVRDTIRQNSGILLPTRKEFSNKKLPDGLDTSIDWDQLYTAATGAALWIEGVPGSSQPLVYLGQNSADKPVNPNRFNFPSRLLSGNIPEQAFMAVNQETGIFLVDENNRRLVGLNFMLPKEMPNLDRAFVRSVLDGRAAQENNIRTQLARLHPGYAELPIKWITVKTETRQEDTIKPVTFDLLGQQFETFAHVLADGEVMSANVHFPVRVDLSKPGIDFTKVVTVDPEKFGRNVGLYSLEDVCEMDTIPAPSDYFSRLER